MIIPVGLPPSGWQHSPDDGRVVTKDMTLRPSRAVAVAARYRSLDLLVLSISPLFLLGFFISGSLPV